MLKFRKPGQAYGKSFLLVVIILSLLSVVFGPNGYDFYNRRPNVSFKSVNDFEDLRQAIRDRFILKLPAQALIGKLHEASFVAPFKGALSHKGTFYFTAPFLSAPTTSFRGLYSTNSKNTLEKNAKHFSLMVESLKRCGLNVFYFLHPTKASAHKLFEHRGDYGVSDIQLFKANLGDNADVVFDLTKETQDLTDSSPLELYYPYGTHLNRSGAHQVAKLILNHLIDADLIDKGASIPNIYAPMQANKFYAVPDERFGPRADEGLFTMINGKNFPENIQYPQLDESVFRNISIENDGWPLILKNNKAFSQLSVTIIGDSFTTYLLPYYSRFFAKIEFHFENSFNGVKALNNGSDLLIMNHIGRVLHYERPFNAKVSC